MNPPMDFRLVGITLEEALRIIHEDDINATEIFIEPPESGILTDEESGDEDECDINHLPGRQLAAGAEVVLANDGGNKESPIAEIRNLDLTFGTCDPKMCSTFLWIDGDFELHPSSFSLPNYDAINYKSPTELFELFIDDEIVNYLVEQSRLYAQFKNCSDPNITADEIKSAIGVMILSGYNKLPRKKFFWDSKSDMRNILASEAIRKNRFISIMQFLHCADNNKPNLQDKAWKIRPFMEKLKTKFMQVYIPEEHLCYDETMVKYYGHHSCKQFIRGKPIRFGLKMWSLNTSSGYLVNFDLYQGKSLNPNEPNEKIFGKCTKLFVRMLNEIPTEKRNLLYKLFFDNLFTSVNLLTYLRENEFGTTGTMRAHRIPKSCPVPLKKALMKNFKRGEHCSTLDRENRIMIVCWCDNNLVTTASTCYGVSPIGSVKRFSRKLKRVAQVPRPHVIGEYNKFMGGTDTMDENVARYRIAIRSTKWWWCLLTWLLDVAIQNARTLYKKAGNFTTQLQFRQK